MLLNKDIQSSFPYDWILIVFLKLKLLYMQRYFVNLSFKGTRYHGWQIQPNSLTVQEVVEKAFSTLLQKKIEVTGAGRTDTGVHAQSYVLHFDAVKPIADLKKLVYGLNNFLPADIAIRKIWKVPPEAHARFSALSRTYCYYITSEKDPFRTDSAYYYRGSLDVEKMNEAAKILLGHSDFTSFSRLHSDVKTNICEIYTAEWHREEKQLVFVIKANRFLRNMVRAVVGTLFDVGKGKIDAAAVEAILEKQDRGAAGASAPALGLFLTDIEYPAEFDF